MEREQREQRERRKGIPAIPDDVDALLSEMQRMALNNMERFGCRVAVVRRPLLQEPVIILVDANEHLIGVLEEDGTLNRNSGVTFREDSAPPS